MKKRVNKKRGNEFSNKEKLSIGIWAIILLFASIGNMAFYYEITLYKEFYMIIPLILVILMQFLSLIEIYLIAKGGN